jgi:hypothetical protein
MVIGTLGTLSIRLSHAPYQLHPKTHTDYRSLLASEQAGAVSDSRGIKNTFVVLWFAKRRPPHPLAGVRGD